jgi:hypothetical protein
MSETKIPDDRESIDNLPARDKVLSEKDASVLDRYFPQDEEKKFPWRVILVATVLYLLLCNPFVNRILDIVPYCSGFIGAFVRTIAFGVVLCLLVYFS